jgi:hypothetical protein
MLQPSTLTQNSNSVQNKPSGGSSSAQYGGNSHPNLLSSLSFSDNHNSTIYEDTVETTISGPDIGSIAGNAANTQTVNLSVLSQSNTTASIDANSMNNSQLPRHTPPRPRFPAQNWPTGILPNVDIVRPNRLTGSNRITIRPASSMTADEVIKNLSRFRVCDLDSFLGAFGLRKSGNKPVKYERAKQYVLQNMADAQSNSMIVQEIEKIHSYIFINEVSYCNEL